MTNSPETNTYARSPVDRDDLTREIAEIVAISDTNRCRRERPLRVAGIYLQAARVPCPSKLWLTL